jgi:integrase
MSVREAPDPDDTIEYFIEHLRTTDKPEGTVKNYERSLGRLRDYLSRYNLRPREATDKECIEFITWLKSELANSTVGTYVSNVNSFYSFYSNRGTFETNPMAIALNEVSVSRDSDRHRREISLVEMRDFVQQIDRPQNFTMIMLFAKTGIRRSELANLDLPDLNIDHSGADRVLPEPRSEIYDRPDSLFVSSQIKQGDVVKGERRGSGNKRKRDTIIPLDDELKRTLIRWVAVRPMAPADSQPLFGTQTGQGTPRALGERTTANMVNHGVNTETKPYGWYRRGGGVQINVTPHYFRHWFVTMAERHGMSRPLVKYIRGDVGSDIADHYRHFWGDEVRDGYIDNIYELLSS